MDGSLVRFGAHSRTHADLTGLDSEALHDEVYGAQKDLEDKLGRAVPDFAPPYGSVNATVLATIKEAYDMSYGVTLGLADTQSSMFDLPRLEMFYYQSESMWRQFLMGRGGMYLTLRQSLRGIKSSVTGLMRGGEMRAS